MNEISIEFVLIIKVRPTPKLLVLKLEILTKYQQHFYFINLKS